MASNLVEDGAKEVVRSRSGRGKKKRSRGIQLQHKGQRARREDLVMGREGRKRE